MSPRKSLIAPCIRRMPLVPSRLKPHLLGALSVLTGRRLVVAPIAGLPLRFDPRDHFQALMALQFYEPEVDGLLRRVLRPGDVYMDIGAQLGYTAAQALRAMKRRGTLLLVEPDPRAHRRLARAFSPQFLADTATVHLHHAACSDARGELRLNLAGTLGHSRFGGSGQSPVGGTRRFRVATIPADDLIGQHRIDSIRFLKIDVEGHEPHVISGLRETLSRRAVDYLLIENNSILLEEAGYSMAHLHAALSDAGYSGARLEERARVTRQSLDATVLENMIYARSENLLTQAGFPVSGDGILRKEEHAQLIAELYTPDHPARAARQCIYRARSGDVAGAIRDAETLLQADPGLTILRGHLAHWHNVSGNPTSAAEHYRRLLEQEPGNAEARRLLLCVEQEQTSAGGHA